jgi:hypothetical protein
MITRPSNFGDGTFDDDDRDAVVKSIAESTSPHANAIAALALPNATILILS